MHGLIAFALAVALSLIWQCRASLLKSRDSKSESQPFG